MPVLRFAPASAAGEPGRERRGELPSTAFNSPPSPARARPRPPVERARHHNVTTRARDSLALLLKVKIPVGAGASDLAASLSSTGILIRPILPFSLSRSFYLFLFFLFSLSRSICLFFWSSFSANSYKRLSRRDTLCVHNGRW